MKTEKPSLRVIYMELAAFSLIISISWADELVNFSHYFLGGNHVPDWHEALFESFITIIVAIPTLILTWNIIKRLHYLEGFLRICAWCKKVGINKQWLTTEEFFDSEFNTKTTHSICPICAEKMREEP